MICSIFQKYWSGSRMFPQSLLWNVIGWWMCYSRHSVKRWGLVRGDSLPVLLTRIHLSPGSSLLCFLTTMMQVVFLCFVSLPGCFGQKVNRTWTVIVSQIILSSLKLWVSGIVSLWWENGQDTNVPCACPNVVLTMATDIQSITKLFNFLDRLNSRLTWQCRKECGEDVGMCPHPGKGLQSR